jgi:hypothetical protein
LRCRIERERLGRSRYGEIESACYPSDRVACDKRPCNRSQVANGIDLRGALPIGVRDLSARCSFFCCQLPSLRFISVQQFLGNTFGQNDLPTKSARISRSESNNLDHLAGDATIILCVLKIRPL